MMIYFFTGILNPVDEFQYWGDLAKRDERAATYVVVNYQ
jgi:hypothetical protein